TGTEAAPEADAAFCSGWTSFGAAAQAEKIARVEREIIETQLKIRALFKLVLLLIDFRTSRERHNTNSLARRIRIFPSQQIHYLLAPALQSLQLARFAFSESVARDERQGHGRIDITDDRARQLVWIDLAPADRLAGRRAGKPAGVRTGVRQLQKVVVAF